MIDPALFMLDIKNELEDAGVLTERDLAEGWWRLRAFAPDVRFWRVRYMHEHDLLQTSARDVYRLLAAPRVDAAHVRVEELLEAPENA